MGIKGKTTFELTDINTGKVEVIEDSNMITNGLQEFLTTYGYFGCDILNNDTMRNNSLWVNLLGGLFLFDTALDEDVNNTFMSAGVKMIGNGSKDVSNSGAITELGSYNTSESGLQSDGSIKIVFDFSTQQANGTIACACLTSKIGGYIGMGNNSNRYYNENYKLSEFLSDYYHTCRSNIAGAVNDTSHILYPVYSENAIYFTNPRNINYSSAYASQHWSTTKKIQILKVRAGFTGVSIKDRQYLDKVIATYDVDIPQNILDYMGTSTNYTIVSRDSIERNVYVIFNKSSQYTLNAGAFCWIMKIDKDMKATAYKFTNNIGVSLDIFADNTTFDGDYLWAYALNSPYYLYGIKYTDSTQIIETGIAKSSKYNLYTIGKNLININDSSSGNRYYYAPTVYDVVNRTHRQVNGAIVDNNCILIPFPDKKGVYLYVYKPSSDRPCDLQVMKDPRCLATINNLSKPVVKTSSKTMKVTYTLTFEE